MISLHSVGFSVKPATNVHHVSGHCWKCFKVREVRATVKPNAHFWLMNTYRLMPSIC